MRKVLIIIDMQKVFNLYEPQKIKEIKKCLYNINNKINLFNFIITKCIHSYIKLENECDKNSKHPYYKLMEINKIDKIVFSYKFSKAD